MAIREGIDTATDVTSHVKALKAAGVRFVCRYVAPPGDSYDWKRCSKAEARAIIDAGLGLVLVFESSAGRALGGRVAGLVDGVTAHQAAADLGHPAAVVYMAVDFDVGGGQAATVAAYLAGAAKSLGKARTGVYGGLAAVSAGHTSGDVSHYWQTYAWSNGVWREYAHLRQYQNGVTIGGVACDRDRAMVDNYGQVDPPRVQIGWTVGFTNRDGERTVQVLGRHNRLGRRQPDAWIRRHRKALERGHVDFHRRFKGER